jgi:hypothetical protein
MRLSACHDSNGERISQKRGRPVLGRGCAILPWVEVNARHHIVAITEDRRRTTPTRDERGVFLSTALRGVQQSMRDLAKPALNQVLPLLFGGILLSFDIKLCANARRRQIPVAPPRQNRMKSS